MNRTKLVVVIMLGVIVLGLAGMLYYSYNPPVLAGPVLGLLALLWLAAVLTRPVGTAIPSKQISSNRWMRGWVLANSLAWMTAAGILLITFRWLGNQPWFVLDKAYLHWMPVVGIILAAVWAAGQWIGLATVLPQAGRWSISAFLGTLIGFFCFIAGLAVLGGVLLSSDYSFGGDLFMGIIMSVLLPVVCLLPASYFTSLWLIGMVSGGMQEKIFEVLPKPIAKWARRNAKIMALSGILGPLGGIVYALETGKILQSMLFNYEEKK